MSIEDSLYHVIVDAAKLASSVSVGRDIAVEVKGLKAV